MKLVKSKDEIFFDFDVYQGLVDRKLATKSFNEELNLATFKYSKKVMFDRLWNTYPALMECRGITFDATTKELKALPFRKSFNYLENDWWKGVHLDTPVLAYKKYNGFMGCITANSSSVVYSTTGSTKSDFVQYIKDIVPLWTCSSFGCSNLYEIMHPGDPHIVEESQLFNRLGNRSLEGGWFTPSATACVGRFSLKNILEDAKSDKSEGWMVYHPEDTFHLSPCKIKSAYYVGKKKLMRMTAKNVELMYNNPVAIDNLLPDSWEDFPRAITELFPKEDWLSYTDQERRKHIEELENNW